MNYSPLFLLTAVCCLMMALTAQADTRSDAVALLAKLRQEGGISRLPDELRSLDATLATAEMYYQLNDPKNADRYYQLAIQKGALIQQQLLSVPPALQTPGTVTSTSSVPVTLAAETILPSPGNSIQKPVSSPTPPASPASNLLQHPTPDIGLPESFNSPRLVGTVGSYIVVKGDTIRLVAAKLGVSRTRLAAMNGLNMKDGLKAGCVLRYNNRRIIPEHKIKDGIVINIPDRMLYLFQHGTMRFSTAVALGTPNKTEQLVWETPIGRFKIVNKAKDPTWTVPPSIQEEMRLEGKEVITSIPPGKGNPLGKYAMKTSLPGILIHSTTTPWSIYTYASHGCIRVYPERMEELFNLVKMQASGEIIYRPIKLAVIEDGRILLEAHSDIYNKTKGLAAEAHALIHAHKLDAKVDWKKVKSVISRRTGVAEEITRVTVEAQKTDTAATTQVHSPS